MMMMSSVKSSFGLSPAPGKKKKKKKNQKKKKKLKINPPRKKKKKQAHGDKTNRSSEFPEPKPPNT